MPAIVMLSSNLFLAMFATARINHGITSLGGGTASTTRLVTNFRFSSLFFSSSKHLPHITLRRYNNIRIAIPDD